MTALEPPLDPQAFAAFQEECREMFRKLDPRHLQAQKDQRSDDFWDIREQEKRVREALDNKIQSLKGAIQLADRIIAVQGQPGWEEFAKALEDCRVFRRQELELSSGTDGELRILQGRCRELGAMMALVRHTEKNRDALAQQLKSLQDERAAIVRPDGKINPQQGS